MSWPASGCVTTGGARPRSARRTTARSAWWCVSEPFRAASAVWDSSLPCAGAEPLMRLQPSGQPLPGRCGLAERGVQEPYPVGVGAHEADEGAVDRARVRDRV